MHWTEWAILVVSVVLAILVVWALCHFLFFAWAMMVALWESRKPLVSVETPFGPFTKGDRQWWGQTEVRGAVVGVTAQDADGSPNPEFLDRLPALLGQLPQLEQAVRQEVDDVTTRHKLSSLSDSDSESVDFTLGFDYGEEGGDEMVVVDFQAGQIIGWTLVD